MRLWEIYLLRSRINLSKTLSAYSLDNGPSDKEVNDPERVLFRFTRFDWDKTIKSLLSDLSIPYEITGNFKVDVMTHTQKKKVYVAEDDLNILFALDTMLEDAGYDVILSHCGAPIMQDNLPRADLFILDKMMPDVDGMEVCRHLKSQLSTKSVPVIMISALRNFGNQALRAGVDDYLEKPFQMQELLKMVAKHTHGAH